MDRIIDQDNYVRVGPHVIALSVRTGRTGFGKPVVLESERADARGSDTHPVETDPKNASAMHDVMCGPGVGLKVVLGHSGSPSALLLLFGTFLSYTG